MMTNADKISNWMSKYYMLIFNLGLFSYGGFALLAPFLMKIGWVVPARIIYSIYRLLCHQLGFRSFYIWGEQLFYPKALAHIYGLLTFEQITGQREINLLQASSYLGNEIIGYKIALCERCLAIYGVMLLFGIIFWITGRKIKSIQWYLWILFGLIPIAIDGLSQLPSLIVGMLPSSIPIRESTPLLRVITGGLFGLTTAWYLFPFVEESMKVTRQIINKKIQISLLKENK